MKTLPALRGLLSALLCGMPLTARCQTSGPSPDGPEAAVLRTAASFPLSDTTPGLPLPVSVAEEQLTLLLDTGSTAHFLDSVMASRTGFPRRSALASTPTGGRHTMIHRLPRGSRMGPVTMEGQETGFFDSGVLPHAGTSRPAGTLGLEVMRQHFWNFDFDGRRLTLAEIPEAAGEPSAALPPATLIHLPVMLPDGTSLPFMLDTGCLAFGTLETEWFDRLQTAGLLTKEAPVEIATSAAPAVKTEQGRLSHFLFQGHRHERELFLRSNANRLGWEFFTRYNWQICLARGMVSILPRQPKSPPRTTAAAAPDSSQTDISSPATGPPEIYRRACISCHGGGGQGQPGLFPPLAGSDWMQAADPARQIRIVLHGMMGPVSIHGKPFTSSAPFMPAQGAALTDAEVAEVLTWARRKFGGQHAVVSPAAVAAVRQAEKDRRSMWRQSELLAISLTEPITP